MKDDRAVARAWIAKAESDLTTVAMCLERNNALDVACFHAQQAAEKYLKAYLIAADVDFPYIHDLERLIDLCARRDPSFATIKVFGQQLTPYAVVPRYDTDFVTRRLPIDLPRETPAP